MLCPNCGQELSDLETICPSCGTDLASPPEAEPVTEDVEEITPPEPAEPAAEDLPTADAEEVPAEEIEDISEESEEPLPEGSDELLPEEAASSETPDADDGTPWAELHMTPAPTKKRPVLSVVLTVLVGLLMVVVVCLSITLTTLSTTGSMPGFVTSISSWFKNLGYDTDAVAVKITDQNGDALSDVTNAQLSYYYWGEFYYYIQSSGMSFDADTPLSEQAYSDTQSWQDYFLEKACDSLVQIEALKAMAEADGFTMPETYQSEYDNTVSSMESYAVQTGFTKSDGSGDVLAYVQDSYGPAATVEDFQQYLYDSYYVTAYSDTIYEGLTFTDQEIEDYFDENSDMFAAYGLEKSDTPNVNVRHILIAPEQEDGETEISDEAWDKAKEEAEKILAEWKSGDADEDSFAALAQEHSADNADAGGLYENVYPGQMVETFNDWCFDDARKAGDTGIVKTDFGYHIIYFVSETDEYYWKTMAENELHYVRYQETLSGITEQYTATPTEKLQLPTPDAVTTLQEQQAANTSTDTNTNQTDVTSAVEGAAG